MVTVRLRLVCQIGRLVGQGWSHGVLFIILSILSLSTLVLGKNAKVSQLREELLYPQTIVALCLWVACGLCATLPF